MPCKRACQTCLAKGLLLCKQACLVTGFFALQSRMPCERASSSTASAHIFQFALKVEWKKGAGQCACTGFWPFWLWSATCLAYLHTCGHTLSFSATFWLKLSTATFSFFGINWKKLFDKPCKGHKSKLWQEHTSKPWKGHSCSALKRARGRMRQSSSPSPDWGRPSPPERSRSGSGSNQPKPARWQAKTPPEDCKITQKTEAWEKWTWEDWQSQSWEQQGWEEQWQEKKCLAGRKRRWVGRKEVAMEGWVWWLGRLVLGRQAPGCMVWGQPAPGKK